ARPEWGLRGSAWRHPGRGGVGGGGKADVRDEAARRPPQARNPFRWLPEAETVALGGLNCERNVSLGGEAVEDARDLERSRQPEPGAAGRGDAREGAAARDGPALRPAWAPRPLGPHRLRAAA